MPPPWEHPRVPPANQPRVCAELLERPETLAQIRSDKSGIQKIIERSLGIALKTVPRFIRRLIYTRPENKYIKGNW
jgi:hypothetical protein